MSDQESKMAELPINGDLAELLRMLKRLEPLFPMPPSPTVTKKEKERIVFTSYATNTTRVPER